MENGGLDPKVCAPCAMPKVKYNDAARCLKCPLRITYSIFSFLMR